MFKKLMMGRMLDATFWPVCLLNFIYLFVILVVNRFELQQETWFMLAF